MTADDDVHQMMIELAAGQITFDGLRKMVMEKTLGKEPAWWGVRRVLFKQVLELGEWSDDAIREELLRRYSITSFTESAGGDNT